MQMNDKMITGLKAAGIVACAAVGSFAAYQGTLQKMEEMQTDYELRLSEQVEVYVTEQLEDTATEVVERLVENSREEEVQTSTQETTLDVDTIYQVQKYDAAEDTTVTEYETLPSDLVGGTRETADQYCQNYMDNVPAEEFLDGLQSMGVVSFSNERLVIKKIYDTTKVDFRYYLIALDGEVVAYYGDKKNIYEYTGIEVKKLPAEDRKALKKGIEVKDEEELYSILENFSS
ncbi:MAG: BofC C-terminal domain-containing protein [Clostridiaceae bacterium]|nr:BofC C-terminal domain-containing protein [Clostridiaceae bacterium]